MTEENKLFGRYLISKFLGSGATSEVYQARDTKLDRQVALKILKPSLVSDQTSFERFTREAQAASKLFHDHIATVLDMGEIEGRYYIAMKYIDGISLDKYIKEKGTLPWEQVQKLARQVGSAIYFAHEQGYLHRDIKPNNIMVTLKGDFVLTDFGLTRAMQESGLTSTIGAVVGTPPYIPPEIWNGKPANPLSDQYSFACVLHEAITGKVLFSGDTSQEILAKHLINRPEISNYPPSVPANIKYIIQKALSKETKDRFINIDAFIKAVENPKEFNVGEYLSSLGSEDRSRADQQALEKLKKKKRRKLKVILILTLILILGIAAGVFYLINKDRISSGINAFLGKEPLETVVVTSPELSLATQTERIAGDNPETPILEQNDETVTQSIPMQSETASALESEPETLTNTSTMPPTNTPTSKPTSTPTKTATNVPAPTKQAGEGGQVPIGSGVEISMVDSNTTGLEVYFLWYDGTPIKDLYTNVYSQVQDISGNWVTGDRLDSEYTDNTGGAFFQLNPGSYIISADFNGYNWGDAKDVEGQANILVEQGKRTVVVVRLARITVGFAYADGYAVEDKFVEVCTQTLNISNQWVATNKCWSGYTSNTGTKTFNITAGNYLVIADFKGYNWGNAVDTEGMSNIPAWAGEEYKLITYLSRLVIKLKDVDNNPIVDGYVAVFYQDVDVSGNPTLGKSITWDYTGNTGSAAFDLTPGVYAFSYKDVIYYNIELQPGMITETDGINTEIYD